jgi:hypothetical protein
MGILYLMMAFVLLWCYHLNKATDKNEKDISRLIDLAEQLVERLEENPRTGDPK